MTGTPRAYAPLDIVTIAMDCGTLDALRAPLDFAAASDDPWVLNAGILAIGHAARRFRAYPRAMKERLWGRIHQFPDLISPRLAGTRLDAEGDIAHFGAKGV
jgi:hypothetical protein